MSSKNVALIGAIAVIALVVADAFVVYQLTDPARYVLHTALRTIALAVAAIATALAAARFGWTEEYVGRGWTLLFVLYALLTVSYVLNRTGMGNAAASDVMTIVGNVAAVGAFWLFGRALKVAGLQFYGPAAIKIGVFVAAVVVACVLVMPTIVDVWRSNAGGLSRAADFISAAADIMTFVLIAPLLLTLWSFRGGQLASVYGGLAVSTLGWMINTGADDLLPRVAVRDAQMTGLFLACMAVAAAAYSQLAASRTGGVANV